MEVFHLLEKEGYKKWEVGRLDPWYVRNVILYPRDDKGALIPRPIPPTRQKKNQEWAFWKKLKDKGYPDWRIQERWEETVNRDGG